MTDINTELPPINERIDEFITFVTAYLPITEEDHHVGETSNLSEWVNEMAVSAPWDLIPDDVVNREYSRALAIYCANGPPPHWIIQAIEETTILNLENSKLISAKISDVRKNIKLNRFAANHNFCLRLLLRDLFAVIDAHHLSST